MEASLPPLHATMEPLKTYVIQFPGGSYKVRGHAYLIYDRLRVRHIPLEEYLKARYITLTFRSFELVSFSWFWTLINEHLVGLPLEDQNWKTMTLQQRLKIFPYLDSIGVLPTNGRWAEEVYMWYYTHLLDDIRELKEGELEAVDWIVSIIPLAMKVPRGGRINPFDVAYSRLAGIPLHLTPGLSEILSPSTIYNSWKYAIIQPNILISSDDEDSSDNWALSYTSFAGTLTLKMGRYTFETDKGIRDVTDLATFYFPGETMFDLYAPYLYLNPEISVIVPDDFWKHILFPIMIGSITLHGEPLVMRKRSPLIKATIEEEGPFSLLAGDKVVFGDVINVWSYINGITIALPEKRSVDEWKYINYFGVDVKSDFVLDYAVNIIDNLPVGWNRDLYLKVLSMIKNIPRITGKLELEGPRIDNILSRIWVPGDAIFDKRYSTLIPVTGEAKLGDVCVLWYIDIPDVEKMPEYGNVVASNVAYVGVTLTNYRRVIITAVKVEEVWHAYDEKGLPIRSVITIGRDPEGKRPRFHYISSFGRPYNNSERDISLLEFNISRGGEHKHEIRFDPHATEKEAVEAAEEYLSQPLTAGYFEKVKDDLFAQDMSVEEALAEYPMRGSLLINDIYLRSIEGRGGGRYEIRTGS